MLVETRELARVPSEAEIEAAAKRIADAVSGDFDYAALKSIYMEYARAALGVADDEDR
jgi:hypothetical protein